jgi:hypothetical protein
MPKNDVEEILSATADFLESAITDDPDTQSEIGRLVALGQKPHVTRLLNSVEGASATIIIEKL